MKKNKTLFKNICLALLLLTLISQNSLANAQQNQERIIEKAEENQEIPLPTVTPTPLLSNDKGIGNSIITAIPPHLNIMVDPGETIQETLKVQNDSGETVILETAVTDFIVLDSFGTPQPVSAEANNRWSLSKWLTVSPEGFTLKPGEIQVVSLIVTVPADGLPGGHYAMVTYQPAIDGMLGATGSQITQRVGSLINVTVAGNINEDAQITKFVPSTRFAEYGPIDFSSEIKNLSEVHITPAGSIKITDMMGNVSAVLPLEKYNIFPLASREYENTFEGKWRFGKYKAELLSSYGSTGQTLSAIVYFWILPWKIILLVLTVIVLLALTITTVSRKKKKQFESEVNKKVQEVLKNEKEQI